MTHNNSHSHVRNIKMRFLWKCFWRKPTERYWPFSEKWFFSESNGLLFAFCLKWNSDWRKTSATFRCVLCRDDIITCLPETNILYSNLTYTVVLYSDFIPQYLYAFRVIQLTVYIHRRHWFVIKSKPEPTRF